MAVESGLRPQRLEYVRETTEAAPNTNPAWLLFSDSYQSINFGPQAIISARRRVGNADIQAFNAGAEDHTFEITYDLQQWFQTAGSPLDASSDGMVRNANGELINTHHIVARDTLGDGISLTGRRLYTVVGGGKINTVTVTGEPESGDPIVVTLSYLAKKTRSYLIDQPLAASTITVTSTDAADDGVSITIEDDGAILSEAEVLDLATPPSTVGTFSTIDALYLDGPIVGNVTISDGTNDLATIYGSDAYQTRESDRGVPLLGTTGTHASAIGGAYENLLGDTIERPAATAILDGVDINSVSFQVDNALEATATHTSIGKIISEGPRTITLTATMFGEKTSYDTAREHLQVVSNNIVWTLTGGTLTLNAAVLTQPGTIGKEAEAAVLTMDNTFTATTLTIAP